MGIQRPKRLLHGTAFRASVVRSVNKADIKDGGIVVFNPSIYVEVRAYCAKLRSFWHNACKTRDIVFKPMFDLVSGNTLYRCTGSEELLTSLVNSCESVHSWQYVMSGYVGFKSVGCGELKVRQKPKKKRRKYGHGEPNGPYDKDPSANVYGTHGDIRVG